MLLPGRFELLSNQFQALVIEWFSSEMNPSIELEGHHR